jgi:membrane-associated protease RseP (regulator of RpoE activity)
MRNHTLTILAAAAAAAAAALAPPLVAPADAQITIRHESSAPRGWIGITRETNVSMTSGGGIVESIRILEVMPGSPAQSAGLRAGDEVLQIDGVAATDQGFAALARSIQPGAAVTFRVRRDGRELDVRVVAAEWPESMPARAHGTTIFRVDPDSVLGLARHWLDSARVAIENIRIPHIIFEAGSPDDTLRWRALRPGVFTPFAFDSIDGRMRIMINADSLVRAEMDDLRGRMRTFEWSGWNDSTARRSFMPRDSAAGFFFEAGPVRSYSIVERALFGAEMADLDPAMESYFGVREGVLILKVPAGTPADRAGLRPGDIVVRAGDAPTPSVTALRRAFAAAPRGEPLRLEIRRERQPLTVEFRQ